MRSTVSTMRCSVPTELVDMYPAARSRIIYRDWSSPLRFYHDTGIKRTVILMAACKVYINRRIVATQKIRVHHLPTGSAISFDKWTDDPNLWWKQCVYRKHWCHSLFVSCWQFRVFRAGQIWQHRPCKCIYDANGYPLKPTADPFRRGRGCFWTLTQKAGFDVLRYIDYVSCETSEMIWKKQSCFCSINRIKRLPFHMIHDTINKMIVRIVFLRYFGKCFVRTGICSGWQITSSQEGTRRISEAWSADCVFWE